MDDIFDDIVGGNDNQKNQDKDAGIGVSSLGL
jgi:hypothetical protein